MAPSRKAPCAAATSLRRRRRVGSKSRSNPPFPTWSLSRRRRDGDQENSLISIR
uniref:Uncharacterized protein n=1 Tax=Arundo donax TaxID=35708 RepID=A0A0A8XYJ0_ARUDO